MYYLADITMAYSQYSRPKVANEPPEDDQTGGSSASFSNWRTLINNTAPRKRNMGRVRTTAVRYFHNLYRNLKLDQFQKIREINVCHLYQGLDQSTKDFLMFDLTYYQQA